MDKLIMSIVDKEFIKLNTTYTILEQTETSKRIKTSTDFMNCYRHIKNIVKHHKQYDGWDYTCKKGEQQSLILDASLYFNWPHKSKKEGYAFVLTFESEHVNIYNNLNPDS